MNTFPQRNLVNIKRGYVALMSALLLSTILMLLTFTANSDAFITRSNLSYTEDHMQAKHLAAACGSIALRIIVFNPNRIRYEAPIHVKLSEDLKCSILPGTFSGDTMKVTTRAQSGYSVSILNIQAVRVSSTSPFIPTYWSETSFK